MYPKIVGFLWGVLLLSATVCTAQSTVSRTVNIAQGSSVKLTANAKDAVRYQWIKDGELIQGATSITYTTSTAGTYNVVAYNANDCISDASDPLIIAIAGAGNKADVSIKKAAEIRAILTNEIFEYLLTVKNNGPDVANKVKVTDLLPVELVFQELITPSTGAAQYQQSARTIHWEISKLAVNETAELRFKVKSAQAGAISNSAIVTADDSDPKLVNNISTDIKHIVGVRIPNVFTPNNDGKNETFKIVGLENYTENELQIVNRWGSPVYEKKGYANDWTANGLVDGTYFYVLRVKTPTSTWQEFKGYITILR